MSSAGAQDVDIWCGVEPAAGRRLLEAAVDSFATKGFHATTTRAIAERAGLSPAAMYVHFRSKVDVLCTINVLGHAAVLREIEQALIGIEAPPERLRVLIRAFVAWHVRNRTLARVIQYEREAIPPERYGEIRLLRRRFEAIFRAELQAGLDAGAFVVAEPELTVTALLSLGIDVARWHLGRRPTAEQLGSAYAELALRMVRSDGA